MEREDNLPHVSDFAEETVEIMPPLEITRQESGVFTAEEVIKREDLRVKRAHRRNSSLNFQTCNRRQWLGQAFNRFKSFIDEVSRKTLYTQEFGQWFGKISSINMMWLSLEATEEFQPVLSIIKRGGTKEERDKAIDEALQRLALLYDLDLEVVSPEDYDKIMRYIALFCVSCIEDQ